MLLWGVEVRVLNPLPNALFVLISIRFLNSGVIATFGSVIPYMSMLSSVAA